jgi:hypothetical protein
MKRSPLIAAATLTLLITSATDAAQSNAQEEVLMPEIAVSGQAEARRHPQDSIWSERPLGCVEVITPSRGGDAAGAYAAASKAKEGIPVIPDLNDPRSASDQNRRGPTYYQHPNTPPGQAGKPGCQR